MLGAFEIDRIQTDFKQFLTKIQEKNIEIWSFFAPNDRDKSKMGSKFATLQKNFSNFHRSPKNWRVFGPLWPKFSTFLGQIQSFFTPNDRDISKMGVKFGTLQKNFYNFPRSPENWGVFGTFLSDLQYFFLPPGGATVVF